MLKEVTYEEFIAFSSCWLESDNGKQRLKRYAKRLGGKATALDILSLNRVSTEDRLWAVLREEFIDPSILHEFACRCAERALTFINNPDQRSIAAIEAKRKWLRNEISDMDLAAAWDATCAAGDAACVAMRQWKINELTRMLNEEKWTRK